MNKVWISQIQQIIVQIAVSMHMRQVDPLATTCWVLTQRIGNFDAWFCNWQHGLTLLSQEWAIFVVPNMPLQQRGDLLLRICPWSWAASVIDTSEHLNNVVSRNLRSSDRWTYRTLVVTLSSNFKEVKNNRFVCPILRFVPDMKPWFFAKAFRWWVAPCGAEVALRSPGGVAWRVLYDVFDASTERCFKPALAGCNDRGTWCLIQFTSVHVQMAVTRPLSCGVIWNSCSFKIWLHFVAISLHFTTFHFRTSILSVFSRHRPNWFSRPQNEGPETRCIQLVTSHRHSSNMSNHITIKPKCEWKHCFFNFHFVHFVHFVHFSRSHRPRWAPTRE